MGLLCLFLPAKKLADRCDVVLHGSKSALESIFCDDQLHCRIDHGLLQTFRGLLGGGIEDTNGIHFVAPEFQADRGIFC